MAAAPLFPSHWRDQLQRSDDMAMLTVRQAAERLGVGYSTLKQWIYKGSVRTTRTEGGHHRIAETEVERLLAKEGRVPSARTPRRAGGGVLMVVSGRNRLRGIVDEVRRDGLIAQVRLRIGDQRLTAVITREALDELRLKRGDEATALIKATEVMIAREAPAEARRQKSEGRSQTETGG